MDRLQALRDALDRNLAAEHGLNVKTNSGKLLIAAMLGAGVLTAAASWWFRYAATHRTDLFWGPQAATLIRDAPHVDLLALRSANDAPPGKLLTVAGVPWRISSSQDISHAPGLTHLRNALLEDRSFDWPAVGIPAEATWAHGLRFHDGLAPPLVILFSPDFALTASSLAGSKTSQAVSCAPIAEGLSQVFVEWAQPAPGSGGSSQKAGDR